jgi:uncharacterized Ntn-hydrolase superfamily protein
MTFSLVARSDDGESWGVAVASKFLAVGAIVSAARAGVGAVATQAHPNLSYKPRGLAAMAEGRSAEETLALLVESDDRRADRQVGLVDSEGRAASHTGDDCLSWAGGTTGPGFAAQGNILAGPQVLDALVAAWQEHAGEPDLARRLVAALAAGDRAGGDRRGRQSAAVLVVREGAGYGFDDVAVDLRVDDHPDPVTELARLLALNDLYLTASTEDEKVAVTPDLATELDERARAAGHADFLAWVGSENYEMRVADDAAWIDRKVLGIIRGEDGGAEGGEDGA